MSGSFSQSVQDKAKAAYLGLAIGDALGATVEFMTPNEIQTDFKLHKNIIGGGWLKLKPGRVTDDTEMSLALGDALLSCETIDVNAIAESFSQWMCSKPVDIGNTVRRGLFYCLKHGEASVTKSEFNAGNGACMRCLPIALSMLGSDKSKVIEASRLQAHITHHSNLSDAGTEHVLDLVQMALMGSSIDELHITSNEFVFNNPKYDFHGKKVTNPGGFIIETLQAVFQSFYTTDSFESCLIDVVNRGGDADTTGAIAGMLAGAYYGLDDIPDRWLKQLDQKVKALCEMQATELLNNAPMTIASKTETTPAQKTKQSSNRFEA